MFLHKLIIAITALAFACGKVKGDFSDIVLVGDECTPLVTGTENVTLGEVCTVVTADTIEVTINITGLGFRCCLKETHICNFPMEMMFEVDPPEQCVEVKTYTFTMDILSDFMCVDGECDMFQLDGHATVLCDTPLPGDEGDPGDPLPGDEATEFCYGAMYWIMFECTGCSDSTCPACEPGFTTVPAPDCCICETVCEEDQFLTPECTCSDEECDACPDGFACYGMGNDPKICIDCNCGFCRPDEDMTSCCSINGGMNNCNNNKMDGLNQCQGSMDLYWPSYMDFNGAVCGGVEVNDNAIDNGCGCKPSYDTLCAFNISADPCTICTFFDMQAPGGACSGNCRDCAINECGINMTCIDEAVTMDDMKACAEALEDDGQEPCLESCDCTKLNE